MLSLWYKNIIIKSVSYLHVVKCSTINYKQLCALSSVLLLVNSTGCPFNGSTCDYTLVMMAILFTLWIVFLCQLVCVVSLCRIQFVAIYFVYIVYCVYNMVQLD